MEAKTFDLLTLALHSNSGYDFSCGSYVP